MYRLVQYNTKGVASILALALAAVLIAFIFQTPSSNQGSVEPVTLYIDATDLPSPQAFVVIDHLSLISTSGAYMVINNTRELNLTQLLNTTRNLAQLEVYPGNIEYIVICVRALKIYLPTLGVNLTVSSLIWRNGSYNMTQERLQQISQQIQDSFNSVASRVGINGTVCSYNKPCLPQYLPIPSGSFCRIIPIPPIRIQPTDDGAHIILDFDADVETAVATSGASTSFNLTASFHRLGG